MKDAKMPLRVIAVEISCVFVTMSTFFYCALQQWLSSQSVNQSVKFQNKINYCMCMRNEEIKIPITFKFEHCQYC